MRYGNGRIRVDGFSRNGMAVLRDRAIHRAGHPETIRGDLSRDRFPERRPTRYDATIPGSGVGLPIARALVEAHGGKLVHRPSPHLGGACFLMSLPAVAPLRHTPPTVDTNLAVA